MKKLGIDIWICMITGCENYDNHSGRCELLDCGHRKYKNNPSQNRCPIPKECPYSTIHILKDKKQECCNSNGFIFCNPNSEGKTI